MKKKEPASLVRWIRKWGEGKKAVPDEVPPDGEVRVAFQMAFPVERETTNGITVRDSATLSVVASIAQAGDLSYLVIDTLWPADPDDVPEVFYGRIDIAPLETGEDEEDIVYQLLQMANQCNEELPAKTLLVEQEGTYYLQVRNFLPLALCTPSSTHALLDLHALGVSSVLSLYRRIFYEPHRRL